MGCLDFRDVHLFVLQDRLDHCRMVVLRAFLINQAVPASLDNTI